MLEAFIPTVIDTTADPAPSVIVRFYSSEATASGYDAYLQSGALSTGAMYTPHPLESLLENAATHMKRLSGVLPEVNVQREVLVDSLIDAFYATSEPTPLD